MRYNCKVVPWCADVEKQVYDAVRNICVCLCADMDIRVRDIARTLKVSVQNPEVLFRLPRCMSS